MLFRVRRRPVRESAHRDDEQAVWELAQDQHPLGATGHLLADKPGSSHFLSIPCPGNKAAEGRDHRL